MKFDAFGPVMARPLGVRGHQKRSLLVASVTMGRELRVESELERCTALALDVHPGVSQLAPQPFTARLDLEQLFPTKKAALLAYPPIDPEEGLDGQPERLYTPDFAALAGLSQYAVESKHSSRLEGLAEPLSFRRSVLDRLGYRFITVTELDVGHPGLAGNLVHLRDAMNYHGKNDTRAESESLACALSQRSEPFLLQEIRGQVSDLGIYLGLARGVIACDLRQGSLGIKTQVWPAHGDLAHLQLINLEG